MMTRPFAFCLLALAALVWAGSYGCPDKGPEVQAEPDPQARPLPEVPSSEIFDQRYGVRLSIPSGWEVIRREDNPVLFAAPPDADARGPMVNLVVEELNQRMAAYDYLEANLVSMRVSLPDIEYVQGGVYVDGNQSVAWIQYVYHREAVKVEAVSYCRTRNYRAYVVTGIAARDQFDEHEPLLRFVCRSLQVD